MKSIMLAVILAGSMWAADDTADRRGIEKTLEALSGWPPRADLFTADFDGRAELMSLATVVPGKVVISKEPWGEATWGPGGVSIPAFVAKKIRLVTADVAMVDAAGGASVLFVMRKEATAWKIASLRILAMPRAVALR